MKDSAECDNKSVLDLSKQQLRKIPKQPGDVAQHVRVLILDENELQKIDNVDSYMRIEHLSVCKNQLLRMYGVCRLHHLQQLHLAYNGILTIEGMKELAQLRHLNLEGNNIKAIEHLSTNCKLEYLNLSENSIASISDLSYLKSLKELNVQGNRITHLRQCDKFLPSSLETLQLAKNGITDLNEICTLGHLVNLNAISVADNPCVQMTGSVVGFDHRPFVLNWCMTVKTIDGFAVNPIESLKAEWLYSQGRGRQFRIGEQQPLARYLSSVCPLSGEVLENENERKLRLILSKAQQHQRQLQEEIVAGDAMTASTQLLSGGGGGGSSCTSTSSNSPSSARRRQQQQQHHHSGSRIQSPRFSRLGRQGSPDSSMSSSQHGNTSLHDLGNATHATTLQMTSSLISNIKADDVGCGGSLMAQSLDAHILSGSSSVASRQSDMRSSPQLMAMLSASAASNSNNSYTDSSVSLNRTSGGNPLSAASKMVPVPESLMSPDCPPLGGNVVQRSASASLCAGQVTPQHAARKSSGKLHDSPKATRTSTSTARARQASPVLTQTRKVHQNLMNSIQLQQQQQQLQHGQQQHNHHQHNHHSQQHALPSSSVHVTPPDAQSTATNSDNEDDMQPLPQQHQQQQPRSFVHSPEPAEIDANDCEDVNTDKLKTIRNKAAQRSLLNRPTANVQQRQPASPMRDNKHSAAAAKRSVSQQRSGAMATDEQTIVSAILIQKLWRGHQARQKFKAAAKVMQTQRTQNYIEKLTADMETTKIALENERKIQQLQMQAINALWKKVSNMPTAAATVATAAATIAAPATAAVDATIADASGLLLGSNQSQAIVQDLAKTCSVLTSQVQQLQGSMHDILQCMTVFCQLPQQQQQQQQQMPAPEAPPRPTVTSMVADTQTEIVAVHTPQVDQLPFPFRTRFAGVPPTSTTSCAVGTTPPPTVRLQRPSTLPLDATVGPSETTPPDDDDDDDDGADDEDVGCVEQTPAPDATPVAEHDDHSVDAGRLPTKSVE